MPVYAIIKLDTIDSAILQEKFNLEKFSIFYRGTMKNIIREMIREASKRLCLAKDDNNGQMREIRETLGEAGNNEEIKIFAWKRKQIRLVAITDGKYSSVIGHKLLDEAFENSDYDKLIQDYKNWQDRDIMKKIEDELESCNIIVVEGLSRIFKRNETLDDLVAKSENLSVQTKLLFKTARKKNSCC